MNKTVAKSKNKTDSMVQIFGVKISSTSKERVLVNIKEKLENRHKFYVVTPNPEILLLAKKDILLREILNKAHFSIPDGVGLKFMANINPIHGRVLFMDILTYLNEKKGKVFLLGGKDASLTSMAVKNLSKRFDGLTIKGESGPMFTKEGKPITKKDMDYEGKVVENIQNFKPDMLFVGFGAPIQEKWGYRNFDKLNAVGIMVVGRTLEYYSGKYPLPPMWLDKLGLEWLWRLLTGSTNINRIFNAVIVFPLEVLKSKFR